MIDWRDAFDPLADCNIERIQRLGRETGERWKRENEAFVAAHGRDWTSLKELRDWLAVEPEIV